MVLQAQQVLMVLSGETGAHCKEQQEHKETLEVKELQEDKVALEVKEQQELKVLQEANMRNGLATKSGPKAHNWWGITASFNA